jgi:hypothetical protein
VYAWNRYRFALDAPGQFVDLSFFTAVGLKIFLAPERATCKSLSMSLTRTPFWSSVLALLVAGAVVLPPTASARARTCFEYTALRVARFRTGAEHAVAACLRRGGSCPDARLTARLAMLHRVGVRAIERRCPGSGGEAAIAAAEAAILCQTLAVCPQPTPLPTHTPRPADPPFAHLDAGWTGIAHDLSVPTAASATAALSNCDGATDTVCDLFAATTGTSFGPPTPMSAGGVATCVTFAFATDMTGTFDTGALAESSALRIAYYLGDVIDAPCPVCLTDDGDPQLGEAGICQLGANDGSPCTVEALAQPRYGRNRATSNDCAPDPTRLVGDYQTPLTATTGTSSFGTTGQSPSCSGDPGSICMCSTCNTAANITCTSNADCPVSGGAPGICGGRRCLGGPNVGAPCTSSSACPGAPCSRTGEPTRPTSCIEDTDSAPPPTGTECIADTTEVGACRLGPLDQVCELQPHRGCTTDADCQSVDFPGDVCVTQVRPCFLDPILATGTPDVPVGDVAHPLLAGSFCLAPTRSAAVNVVNGFPGPARIVFPLELAIAP